MFYFSDARDVVVEPPGGDHLCRDLGSNVRYTDFSNNQYTWVLCVSVKCYYSTQCPHYVAKKGLFGKIQ